MTGLKISPRLLFLICLCLLSLLGQGIGAERQGWSGKRMLAWNVTSKLSTPRPIKIMIFDNLSGLNQEKQKIVIEAIKKAARHVEKYVKSEYPLKQINVTSATPINRGKQVPEGLYDADVMIYPAWDSQIRPSNTEIAYRWTEEEFGTKNRTKVGYLTTSLVHYGLALSNKNMTNVLFNHILRGVLQIVGATKESMGEALNDSGNNQGHNGQVTIAGQSVDVCKASFPALKAGALYGSGIYPDEVAYDNSDQIKAGLFKYSLFPEDITSRPNQDLPSSSQGITLLSLSALMNTYWYEYNRTNPPPLTFGKDYNQDPKSNNFCYNPSFRHGCTSGQKDQQRCSANYQGITKCGDYDGYAGSYSLPKCFIYAEVDICTEENGLTDILGLNSDGDTVKGANSRCVILGTKHICARAFCDSNSVAYFKFKGGGVAKCSSENSGKIATTNDTQSLPPANQKNVTCPDVADFCQKFHYDKCPNDCSGKGYCVTEDSKKKCICFNDSNQPDCSGPDTVVDTWNPAPPQNNTNNNTNTTNQTCNCSNMTNQTINTTCNNTNTNNNTSNTTNNTSTNDSGSSNNPANNGSSSNNTSANNTNTSNSTDNSTTNNTTSPKKDERPRQALYDSVKEEDRVIRYSGILLLSKLFLILAGLLPSLLF